MTLEQEIFTAIRDVLKGDGTLMGYVESDADRIRHSLANVESDTPCITYHAKKLSPDAEVDAYGKFFMQIQVNVFDVNNSTGITNMDNIKARIDELLYDQRFSTASYRVGHIQHSGWQRIPTEYLKEGEIINHAFAEWMLRIYKTGS